MKIIGLFPILFIACCSRDNISIPDLSSRLEVISIDCFPAGFIETNSGRPLFMGDVKLVIRGRNVGNTPISTEPIFFVLNPKMYILKNPMLFSAIAENPLKKYAPGEVIEYIEDISPNNEPDDVEIPDLKLINNLVIQNFTNGQFGKINLSNHFVLTSLGRSSKPQIRNGIRKPVPNN